MQPIGLVLFSMLRLSDPAAAQATQTIRGSCETPPLIPQGFELSSVEFGSEDRVIEPYDPAAKFPHNSCGFFEGVLRQGRCVEAKEYCDYHFKEALPGQGALSIRILQADCGRNPPPVPREFTLVSTTAAVRTVVSELYRISNTYPANDCYALLGPTARVEEGSCTRQDNLCTYAYQRPLGPR